MDSTPKQVAIDTGRYSHRQAGRQAGLECSLNDLVVSVTANSGSGSRERNSDGAAGGGSRSGDDGQGQRGGRPGKRVRFDPGVGAADEGRDDAGRGQGRGRGNQHYSR